MRALILTAIIVVCVAAAATIRVSAADAKACGTIRMDGAYYTVGGAGVSCRYMRRWSRRMIRDRWKPRGWDKCWIRRSSGGCQRGRVRNRDFFIYYPPD
jgi:hypothetical protein